MINSKKRFAIHKKDAGEEEKSKIKGARLIRMKGFFGKLKIPKIHFLTGEKSEKKREIKSEKKIGKKIGNKKQIESKQNEKFLRFSRVRGIRTKLIGSFLIPVFLIILLGTISYQQSSKNIIENYEVSTLSNVNTISKYFELGFDTATSRAGQINADFNVKNYFSGFLKDNATEEGAAFRDGTRSVESATASDMFISGIYVFANYGSSISSLKGMPGGVYEEFIQSEEGKACIDSGEQQYWIGKHDSIDKLAENKIQDYAISLVRTLTNKSNKSIGYIVIDVGTEVVTDLLDDVNLGDGALVGFVTKDGKEIYSGDIKKGFTFSTEQFYLDSLKNEETKGSKYVEYKGQQYLYTYSQVYGGNTTICSLIPRAVIVKQTESLLYLTILIVIIASIIAIVIGTIIASGIGRTIHKTNKVLEKASNGDLTVEINVKRKDEFNILGRCITNMIGGMRSLIEKVEHVGDTVNGAVSEVTSNAEILLKASKDISCSINEIEQGISQQAADSESCLVQMAELSEKINSVVENTNQIDSISKNTQSIVGEGIVIVDALDKKVKDTTQITKSAITDIETLELKSRSIGVIISTINDIAEQTNLLSLNASIEAARAGSAGRGFSVVADEIRKLAEQSANAARQIGTIIDEIQAQTRKTVTTVKRADDIASSQEEALKDTIRVFSDVNSEVESLAKNLSFISEEMIIMERAKRDTLEAIESISATSQQTAAASGELSATAENQLTAVEALNQAAVALESEAARLDDTIKVFKTK